MKKATSHRKQKKNSSAKTNPVARPKPDKMVPASDLLQVQADERYFKDRAKPQFSIVGIGASAGGFEAFGQLLRHLPDDTGMAFVLIQHLDPDHASKLSELLSRISPIPVREVTNGMRVEPNHIYAIPQNVDLRLDGGQLRLTPRKDGLHMPIDLFFRSLAEELNDLAIGVVLSGNGTDGTLGVQEIKGSGGITFAQEEASAKFFGMPGSAIATGCIDFVLPTEKIGQELGRMARHPLLRRAVAVTREANAAAEESEIFHARDHELGAIFGLLRSRTAVDFSLYKHTTLKRRILRRMVLHKIDALSDYLKMLKSNPAEVDALFNDILINVTSFFRDPQAFQTLQKKTLPKLMKSGRGDAPLRAWVCGCSTGEEAYSLAMALCEFMEETHSRREVQIFATDISEVALDKARAGIYPENIQLDVAPARLRRFFVQSNGNYQVNKVIRDICVFARQNVLVDPPFSHMDIISCRNVLIYFGPALQRKVLPIFHYALKPEGFLMLGSSETVNASSDLFSLVDKKSKIYVKNEIPFRSRPPLSDWPASGIERRHAHSDSQAKSPAVESSKSQELQEKVDHLLLSRFVPPAVVINKDMEVLQFRGRTGPYLEHAPGAASLNLLKMAREGLVVDLRTAIANATRKGAAARQESVRLLQKGTHREIAIEVVPFQFSPSGESFYLVIFEETPPAVSEAPPRKGSKGRVKAQTQQGKEVNELEQELACTRESLQAIIEEQEATNEELKSANEEIQSSNEELQSTNEELETAKEELQSTNEELSTINEELQNRNTELGMLNNDLSNLLGSVNVAILMLGNDLTIRRFTPLAERVFNLIPSDVGRRLSDLNRSILVPDLDKLIHQVIQDLSFLDREVQDTNGRWYSLRIRPYRTRENRIDGAVLLLVDIDEHIRAIEDTMALVDQPLIALRANLQVKKANTAFYEKFHVRPEETEGHFVYELGSGQWNIPELRKLLEEVLPKDRQVNNYQVEATFAGLGRRLIMVSARRFFEAGKGLPLILLSLEDVSAKSRGGLDEHNPRT